jgi:hypothetical protein
MKLVIMYHLKPKTASSFRYTPCIINTEYVVYVIFACRLRNSFRNVSLPFKCKVSFISSFMKTGENIQKQERRKKERKKVCADIQHYAL